LILGSNGWGREDITALLDMVQSGRLEAVVDAIYPLERAAEALARGVTTLTAAVLWENRRMLRLAESCQPSFKPFDKFSGDCPHLIMVDADKPGAMEAFDVVETAAGAEQQRAGADDHGADGNEKDEHEHGTTTAQSGE